MKKPKLLIKVDRNNRGKVYFGGKWQTDIKEIKLHGLPYDYELTLTKYKRGKNGIILFENGEPVMETKTIHICRKQGEKE